MSSYKKSGKTPLILFILFDLHPIFKVYFRQFTIKDICTISWLSKKEFKSQREERKIIMPKT